MSLVCQCYCVFNSCMDGSLFLCGLTSKNNIINLDISVKMVWEWWGDSGKVVYTQCSTCTPADFVLSCICNNGFVEPLASWENICLMKLILMQG